MQNHIEIFSTLIYSKQFGDFQSFKCCCSHFMWPVFSLGANFHHRTEEQCDRRWEWRIFQLISSSKLKLSRSIDFLSVSFIHYQFLDYYSLDYEHQKRTIPRGGDRRRRREWIEKFPNFNFILSLLGNAESECLLDFYGFHLMIISSGKDD